MKILFVIKDNIRNNFKSKYGCSLKNYARLIVLNDLLMGMPESSVLSYADDTTVIANGDLARGWKQNECIFGLR